MKRIVRIGQTAIGVVGVLGTLACMGSSWTRGLASSLLSVIMESVCPRRSCRSRERRSRSSSTFRRACKHGNFPLEKVEVSEEAKEPERGDRHRHGKGCPTDGLKWGVRLQLPACPGDEHHQGREGQKNRASQQAIDRHRACCRVDVQADLIFAPTREIFRFSWLFFVSS